MGLFKKIGKEVGRIGHQVEHTVRPVAKIALPIAGAIAAGHLLPGGGNLVGSILGQLAPGIGGKSGKDEAMGELNPYAMQDLNSMNSGQQSSEGMFDELIASILEQLSGGEKGAGHSPLAVLDTLAPKIGRTHQHEMKEGEDDRPFAGGGFVNPRTSGYIRTSSSPGAADNVKMNIPDKSYVLNATDISLLGDGNSENGARKVASWEERVLKSGIGNPHYEATSSKLVPAQVSDGEYVLKPETITIIGKGSNKVGASEVNKMRKNLRKQKGVKDILPPKTKDFSHYMKGGNR